jgi:hypothetical protein
MRTLILLTFLLAAASVGADEGDHLKVGLQPDGRIVVPTNQILQPAGKQVIFPGRPVDLLLIEDGKTLVAKNMKDLVFIDPVTGAIKQTLPMSVHKKLTGGFSAVGLVSAGDRILATTSQSAVAVARRTDGGAFAWDEPLSLKAPAVGGAAYPTGMALQGDHHLWVCASRGNELQLLDLTTGEVEARVPVGVAPYMPVVVGEKVYVSNWGGDPPGKGEATHTTSKTPVRTDPRTSVANHGSVSVVTKSKTCILVTEDDPQNGFDHVDGHRTVGLCISPYTKRTAVDSTCYNQTGMVKTIELILGLPPMTQLDLSATPLRACFTDTPDVMPYTSVKNNVALNEMNPPPKDLKGKALEFAKKSMDLDFDEEDKADEDTLNRILWFAMRGEQKYPGDR